MTKAHSMVVPSNSAPIILWRNIHSG